MIKRISVLAVASMFAAGSASASGWRIPEQSIDSTAKAGANIASADSPDTAYYNPANMGWLDDGFQVEGALTYLHLTAIEYEDARSPLYSGTSEKENFILPTLFMVSPKYNNVRFGFSMTAPYGLSKRWKDPFPKTFAQDFSLQVIEFNPTVSYTFNDMISIGGGVRGLYNKAMVEHGGIIDPAAGVSAYRKVKGDSWEWGYNLALDFKPSKDWNLAVTYRSHVDMDFEGDVHMMTNVGSADIYTTGSVTVPAPAVLALSVAYTWEDWTLDLTYDRTYWSQYENLDFNYDIPLTNPVLYMAFDKPSAKNWDDTNAFRIGVEYKLNETITLMGGFAFDENPAPEETISFELPDSDAFLYSLGARFAVTEQMEIGLAALYDYKQERTVSNSTINGTFTDASAWLLSFGLTYKF